MTKQKERVVIVNQHGEEIVELEEDGLFWRVPTKQMNKLCTLLDIGDVLSVEKLEV